MYSLFECHDTKDYVIKILATCIIGVRKFEEFFVFSGVGSNGKSTVTNITKAAIGP
jgi:phage/plasmid-associated DNA primase